MVLATEANLQILLSTLVKRQNQSAQVSWVKSKTTESTSNPRSRFFRFWVNTGEICFPYTLRYHDMYFRFHADPSSGRHVTHVEQPWALVTRQQAMENWPRYWLVYVQTHESCRPETWQKQVRLDTPSCRAPSRNVQIHMYTHSYKLALQLGTGNYTIKTTLPIQDWLLSNSYLFHKEYIDIKKWFTGLALHIILIFLF